DLEQLPQSRIGFRVVAQQMVNDRQAPGPKRMMRLQQRFRDGFLAPALRDQDDRQGGMNDDPLRSEPQPFAQPRLRFLETADSEERPPEVVVARCDQGVLLGRSEVKADRLLGAPQVAAQYSRSAQRLRVARCQLECVREGELRTAEVALAIHLDPAELGVR